MISFRLATHTVLGTRSVVEVLDGDALVGMIYPHGEGIHVVSKHLPPEPLKNVFVPTGGPAVQAPFPPLYSVVVALRPGFVPADRVP